MRPDMIPTREEIEADWANPRFTPATALIWLCAMRDEIDRLRADLDRANTEAALARDALAKAKQTHSGEINLLQNQLQLAIERTEKLCVKADSAEHWERVAKKAEAALAKATDPVREEDIKAWRDWALGDIADPDLYDDCFVLSRAEIDAAVSLMRRADGKALLRELAPVPDDTRELVAQLADLVAWAMPTMNHHKGVKAIAAKLRGGSTVPVEGTSDEILQLPRDDQRWGLVAQLADVVASIWGRSDCIEGEAKAIAAKLRGGA